MGISSDDLSRLRKLLLQWLRRNAPGLWPDHEDLVQETLIILEAKVLASPGEQWTWPRLAALATVILKCRVVDEFRRRARFDLIADFADTAHELSVNPETSRAALLAQAYSAAMDRLSPAERAEVLTERIPGAPRSSAKRKRTSRARARFLEILREELARRGLEPDELFED